MARNIKLQAATLIRLHLHLLLTRMNKGIVTFVALPTQDAIFTRRGFIPVMTSASGMCLWRGTPEVPVRDWTGQLELEAWVVKFGRMHSHHGLPTSIFKRLAECGIIPNFRRRASKTAWLEMQPPR